MVKGPREVGRIYLAVRTISGIYRWSSSCDVCARRNTENLQSSRRTMKPCHRTHSLPHSTPFTLFTHTTKSTVYWHKALQCRVLTDVWPCFLVGCYATFPPKGGLTACCSPSVCPTVCLSVVNMLVTQERKVTESSKSTDICLSRV